MPAYTNAVQVIPELFKEIMRVDEAWKDMLRQPKYTQKQWIAMKEMKKRVLELHRAAEKALAWNINKGNTK